MTSPTQSCLLPPRFSPDKHKHTDAEIHLATAVGRWCELEWWLRLALRHPSPITKSGIGSHISCADCHELFEIECPHVATAAAAAAGAIARWATAAACVDGHAGTWWHVLHYSAGVQQLQQGGQLGVPDVLPVLPASWESLSPV